MPAKTVGIWFAITLSLLYAHAMRTKTAKRSLNVEIRARRLARVLPVGEALESLRLKKGEFGVIVVQRTRKSYKVVDGFSAFHCKPALSVEWGQGACVFVEEELVRTAQGRGRSFKPGDAGGDE